MIEMTGFTRQWAETREEVLRAVEEVGASGWYILGREVKEFEAALAAGWGLPHAVGVASGLDAIEIGLRMLGCGPGEKVLTTPLSAFATTLAIVKTGATPVFVDCAPSGLIDLAQARQALLDRPDIRFFLPVHLYGQSLPEDALRSFLREFDIFLVEDCAQSIGAPSGRIGQVAATSFYPTKNLGALGDGGALLTASAELDARARQFRDYGQSSKYCHDVIGYNSRLDELQAAILARVFLPRLARWTGRRAAIAARYLSGLNNPNVRIVARAPSAWHLFPVAVEGSRKAEFIAYLRHRGIMTGEHYPIAIPDQPAMQSVRQEIIGELPVARMLCQCEVSLPLHPYLTDEETATVIDAVNNWR